MERFSLSDKTIKVTLTVVSFSFLSLFLFQFFVKNQTNTLLLIWSLLSLLWAYKFSDSFKAQNSLDKLITAEDKKLILRSAIVWFADKTKRSTKIELDRISRLTIGKNWLSVIIDGNRNGYDFQLVGSQQQIDQRLRKLIPPELLPQMTFYYLDNTDKK